MDSITNSVQKGDLSSTVGTLVNSNDNFTLKWYREKLIRLPIKVGTLDFHEIVQVETLERYLVERPT